MADDPYRSLAGFVREAGGFKKVRTPYSEFLWANFYRLRIKEKLISSHFSKAMREALALAAHPEASHLPRLYAATLCSMSHG